MDDWWYCDNIVSKKHKGQIGILHMTDPQVFILIRSYSDSYFASFEEFCEEIAEVNFFHSDDREGTNLDHLLTDAWNFLASQEAMEEYMYNSSAEEDIE